MSKKILGKVTALALAAVSSATLFAGCVIKGKKVANNDQTLEVYCLDTGFGADWLSHLLKDFGQQDWVKEKYPNYNYATIINDQQNYIENRMNQGENNTIDLFFSEGAESFHGTNSILDLTECLYNSTVPGTDTLIKNHIEPALLELVLEISRMNQNVTKEEYYSFMPYAYGMRSIAYNVNLFEELGLKVPNTTDEMFAMMESVKALNKKNPEYPYTYTLLSTSIGYTNCLFPVWWAQYEGATQYENYWKGINYEGVRNSVDVLSQQGRMESLEVIQKLFNENNGYYDRSSSTYDFIAGQTRLILREGLIMAMGDWFSNEMKDLAKEYMKKGYDDVIGMMRTPVISSIVKTLEYRDGENYMPDAVLSKAIEHVDKGSDYAATKVDIPSLSENDFNRIRDARGIVYTDAGFASAVIPAKATAKDLAVDFLRYMATDQANALYYQYSSGNRMGFKFNMMEYAPETYNRLITEEPQIYQMQADVSTILYANHTNLLLRYDVYPLSRYGGLGMIAGQGYGWPESIFIADKGATAKEVFDDTIKYWTENEAARWNRALSNAGLL